MHIDRTKAEDAILIFLMVFSPMFFGGVHVWVYSIVALLSLALFDIHFLFRASPAPFSEDSQKDPQVFRPRVFIRPESIAIILFLVICAMYIVPLPTGVINVISPKITEFRETYAFNLPDRQTLSVYPRATINYLIKLASFVMIYLVVLSKITGGRYSEEVSRPRSVYPAFIMFGALAGALSILFHSFVDFNLHIPGNTLFFTLMLTIIAALGEGKNKVNYIFLNKLVNAIVIIGFCTALFGIIQWFSWNGKMFWIVKKPGSNFGPFVCYNNFAGFMEMTSFMTIALFYSGIFTSPLRHMKKFKDKVIWFSSSEANKTVLYLFASVVMVGSLFLSKSRGGIISFALAFLVFAAVCVAISPRTRKTKLFIVAFFVLGLFVSMIFWLGPDVTISRFRQLGIMIRHIKEGRESFYLLRPLMWIDTVKIIRHFPLVGAGFGGYSNIFIIERSFSANWGFLLYAHQDYLHLLAEMGAVGAVFLTAFIAWYIKKFRNCLKRLRAGAENLEKY
ncbi:MAG: O-antigen ligase family protein [Candidatus Omnitrophota bacterium]